jgi:hypothetical protein
MFLFRPAAFRAQADVLEIEAGSRSVAWLTNMMPRKLKCKSEPSASDLVDFTETRLATKSPQLERS